MRRKDNHETRELNDDLLDAIMAGEIDEVEELVLEEKADIHYDFSKCLRIAVEAGHYGIVLFLLNQKANINVMDGAPLRIAAEFGHNDILQLLLERGADPDLTNSYPALTVAARENNCEALKLLIQGGANVRDKNHCAIRYTRSTEALEILAKAYTSAEVEGFKNKGMFEDIPDDLFNRALNKIKILEGLRSLEK